ncbi:ribosomal RNA small subunit methyltransferase E [Clostridia bacterium]|nr:ribosomal RNA small subunit methyltransferase E [Clostridia bacterium]
MHRFYLPQDLTLGGSYVLPPDESRHAASALRLGAGDVVAVFNGLGASVSAVITQATPLAVAITAKSYLPSNEPATKLALFQGLCKGDKLDWIIQKTTELGVFAIQPVQFARSDVKITHETKLERERRIAISAAKQSGRGVVPEVRAPIGFNEMLARLASFDKTFVCYENETAPFPTSINDAESIAVIVGPEGGIDTLEAERLKAAGAVSVSLGKRVLRTETAAIAAVTCVLFARGEL